MNKIQSPYNLPIVEEIKDLNDSIYATSKRLEEINNRIKNPNGIDHIFTTIRVRNMIKSGLKSQEKRLKSLKSKLIIC